MKSRLIILSDLWGNEKSSWIAHYLNILNSEFEIVYYDCCEIGNIDKSDYTQQNLHSQFIEHGIDNAVEKLIASEPQKVNILAFSIGGTIAWKAGLKGLKINNLFAISSTRLRYETVKPNCNIELVFGEKDTFNPTAEWFKSMNIKPKIIKNAKHEMYKEKHFVVEYCEDFKT